MDYLPIFLNIRDRQVLVVGGGRVATRKADLLQRAGARLQIVAPTVRSELRALVARSGGAIIEQAFEPRYLTQDTALALAATGVPEVDRAVHDAARARAVPVNVADVPALCDFILPSIVDRNPVLIAVSSSGRAPILARRLRVLIEREVPANYARLAEFLGARRALLQTRIADAALRLRVWERLVDGAVAQRVLAGDEQGADRLLENEIAAAGDLVQGEVFLVGAGPGDPDLLTLRALRLMQNCDIVFYDRLVSSPILDLVRRDAERVYVGKQRGEHAVPQPDINQLLVDHARLGKRVLRLKGGDPFIFGRGGEEIAHLADAGIPFQVVPGITAASGCAAYAGIPLTHRDHAQSVRFVTGHLQDGKLELNWSELVQPQTTLVFYMGLVGLPRICEQLIAHGMAAETPVAVVQQGTTLRQRVLVSTLRELPGELIQAGMRAPTLTIVGGVVTLREKLRWFDR